jgi:hypothetical protein
MHTPVESSFNLLRPRKRDFRMPRRYCYDYFFLQKGGCQNGRPLFQTDVAMQRQFVPDGCVPERKFLDDASPYDPSLTGERGGGGELADVLLG